MCDEAVDDCLAALKLVSDCFVTTKTIKKLYNALFVGDNIQYFNEDSGNAVFSCNEMGILNIDIDNINYGDTNYDENDSETIIHIRRLAWLSKFKKHTQKKIIEEIIPVAWYPIKWWNFCIPKVEKKKKK